MRKPRHVRVYRVEPAVRVVRRVLHGALASRSGDFSHPVRWLWVGGVGDLDGRGAVPGLAQFKLA